MTAVYDEGPFRNWTAVVFVGSADTPETIVNGEDALFRTNCADAGTEWDPGTRFVRTPPTGVQNLLCICSDPYFSGRHDLYEIAIPVPIGGDWPICVIGKASGGTIQGSWPSKPSGWDAGTPANYVSTPYNQCGVNYSTGARIGSLYIVRLRYVSNCAGPPGCC